VTDLHINKHSSIPKAKGPVVLIIIDGVGIGARDEFDAFYLARTPVLESLFETGEYRTLLAHGTAVGLPTDGDLGGSEVGHNTMGAGRIIDQGPKLVDNAFADDSVFSGHWKNVISNIGAGGALHLVGLLSDGGIHSNDRHMHQMIERARSEGVQRLYVHVLLDGRDVPDKTGHQYISALESVMAPYCEAGMDYRIVSVGGRMVSVMDRYNANWSVVETGWNAMVHGQGPQFKTAIEGLAHYRHTIEDLSDQYVPAYLVVADNKPTTINDGDGVILVNFRGDRAIELCAAFEGKNDFTAFNRGRVPDISFAGMMLYDGDLGIPAQYLVKPPRTSGCLSEYLAANGIRQFACAETQKYGHVTYFWNGNRSGMFDSELEEYVEILSDVCPFEQRPWMKSAETADALIDAINSNEYQFLRVNFAGGDMVGHSGLMEPTIVALESIDLSVGRVLKTIKEVKGCVILTADHGNAEDMVERDKTGQALLDEEGAPRRRTAHSLNPVPFCILDYAQRGFSMRDDLPSGGLANLAPTILELLGITVPREYTDSLIDVSG
jgi:2,3-bisphosphoglycerate-independent phosphoglycerate mutase